MPEPFLDVFLYRGVERWMIVIGGLIFGYLGYKLFLYGVDQGHGKLQTESQFFKLTFSGSGPGLFFMAFGALILVSSVYSTATRTSDMLPSTSAQASASPSGVAQFAARETMKYASDGAAGACDRIRLEAHDGNVTKALWAYQNAVEETPAGSEIKALAEDLATRVEDEDTLKSILSAIEEVICTLER